MGIGNNFVKFISVALKKSFNDRKILTIGRQTAYVQKEVQEGFLRYLGLDDKEVQEKSQLRFGLDPIDQLFCNSTRNISLDSLDYSNFEGATILHDLNKPLPEDLYEQFDIVIDGGTAEHVFDVRTTFFNYLKLLKPKGDLFLALPANNQFGHGFYQFSPEFFYTLFSAAYGCEVVSMVIDVHPYLGGELANGKMYKVANPNVLGERILLSNKRPTTILVHVRKTKSVKLEKQKAPIQSDYASRYKEAKGQKIRAAASRKSKIKSLLKPMPKFVRNHIIGLGQRAYYSTWNKRFFERWLSPF